MISAIVLAVYLVLAIAFFFTTEDATAVDAFKKSMHRAAVCIFFLVLVSIVTYDVCRYYEVVPKVNISLAE